MTNIVFESVKLRQDASNKYSQASKLEENFRDQILSEIKCFYWNIIARALKQFEGCRLLNKYTIYFDHRGMLLVKEDTATLFNFSVEVNPVHHSTAFRGGFNFVQEPCIEECSVAAFVIRLTSALAKYTS